MAGPGDGPVTAGGVKVNFPWQRGQEAVTGRGGTLSGGISRASWQWGQTIRTWSMMDTSQKIGCDGQAARLHFLGRRRPEY
jgi:hypothetical protein